MKKYSVITILLLFLFFYGCNSAAKKENVKPNQDDSSQIVNYGNGIYYFPFIDEDFGNNLSTFKKTTPTYGLFL